MSGSLCDEKWRQRLNRKARNIGAVVKGFLPLALICWLVVLTLIGSARSVCAQRNLLGKDVPEPTDDLQRLPSDRKVTQQLQELTRLARAGDVAKIRDTLQLLQAADPSLMVADGRTTFRPLHRDLIERIQGFPPELQTELLKQPGATPHALQIAWEDGGPSALVTFLHRHSGSTESFRAHLLLAAIHRDRGHRQATLYWLSPVLFSGAPSDLQKIAKSMRDELNAGIVKRSIKGQQSGSDVEPSPEAEAGSGDAATDPVNPDDPTAKVSPPTKVNEAKADSSERSVDTPPGSTTPNSVSAEKSPVASSVFPHSPAWQRTLHLNSTQRNASQDLVRLLAEEGEQQAIAWMASEPNVDSQAIYIRSSGGLLAFERKTGKVLWTRLLDRLHDQRRLTEPRMRFSDDIDGPPQNALQLQNSREILELHRDEVTAGMTSDASRLFVLCDTGESVGPSSDFSQPFGMLSRRGDFVSRSMRELVAIEKTTGRRLWSAGGAPLEARFGNDLSRAWFAGSPTVSGGMLFGVVERDDAHWLVCLRCETGEVVWKLMLAYPETNIFEDPNRQLTASRPLVADGMIWTSTNDGMLIAADTLTRSVVWTRRMLQTPNETEVRQFRNLRNVRLQAQLKPFRETWRPEALLLLSDSLVIQGTESHQLVMIDPLTGNVRRRVSPKTATIILAVDDEFIVVAGPKKIQRLRLDNFKVDWGTEFVATNVVPTGPGTRLNEHLLIPLSDGSIQIVRYSDGQLTEKIPALRPAFSAGGLKYVDGDVVSYGPDHVSLFSNSATVPPLQPETIDHARFLIETGRFADAEKFLRESTPTSEEMGSVQRLLFRIATARSLNDPTHRDDHIKNAARFAETMQDNAIVQFLTLETQPEITSDVVVDFLTAAPTVLNAELPEPELLKRQLLSPVADEPIGQRTFSAETDFTTTRPLRNLLLEIFEQHLADPDISKSASWLSALKQLSDEDLLSIKPEIATPALQNELLSRADEAIRAGKLTETTWHLLLQARHCENQVRSAKSDSSLLPQAQDGFDAQFASLVDRFRNQLTVETARVDVPLRPHPAALSLVDVVRAEMLPAAAEKSPTPHELLAQQWSTWKDHTYSVVPVNPVSATTMPQPNGRALLPRYRDDQFLSAWRWSTYREPSVLAVRSLIRPDEPLCTIDGGMFDALSLGNSGSVMRFGSVVLVQNSMGLSAVSLIDQRVLWNRRIPNQSPNGMGSQMADMRLFESFLTYSIAWQDVFGRDVRICGGNDRWICVQSPSRVEMIDLLTGQNLWSLHTEPGSHYVFATESYVFLSHLPKGLPTEQRSVTCLNRTDGTQQESRISYSALWRTILATADELVIFEQPGSKAAPASLEWVNSVTGEVRHSIVLPDMINCQFMDARTLVSVTSNGTFEIIDLLTAEKKVVHFSAEANYDAEAEKGTTPEHLSRVLIMADAINYYVLPIPDRQAVQAQRMLGSMGDLQLYPISKELRAIDRATGNNRWVWDVEENTAAWFESTTDPVLLLVGFSARGNNANVLPNLAIPGLPMPIGRRTTITALSKISGTRLFDYAVSSRFPVPGLEFKITSKQHLDLQAFGNHVRFFPELPPTAEP